MALTGSDNNVNILIQSTFENKGFQQAIQATGQLMTALNGAVSGLQKVQETSQKASNFVKEVGTSSSNTAKDMFSATREATKTAEAYREMATNAKAVQQNATYMGQSIVGASQQTLTAATSMGQFSAQTKSVYSSLGEGIVSYGGAWSNFANTVQSGVSRITGYMGGLIKQSISLGDIFGYFIGMMALNAINEFVFGVSTMRNEMETTFEYMGIATSTVKAFSKELTEFAVAMPTLSIKGANEIARTLVLGGADIMEVAKYKQTWADMAEIAASLNGISAEAAAAKVGPAITDAMGGQYKRLLNVMNVTSDQFKTKAAEMGIATEGSFSGTMQVLNAVLGERGLAGIAAKITSISDVWNYAMEMISQKGSEIGDSMLPILIPALQIFANILAAIPTPIMAIIAGFVGFASILMVGLPFLSSFVSGFQILQLAFQPLTGKIKNATLELGGFKRMLGLTNDEMRILDSLSKKQLAGIGVKKTSEIVPGEGKKSVFYEQVPDDKQWKKSIDAAKEYNKVTYQGVSVSSKMNKVMASTPTLGTKLKNSVTGIGSAFTRMGSGIKGAALSMGAMAKQTALFMLTNPIGLILTLVGGFILVMSYTNSWGKLMDLLNKILTETANILEPLVAWIVDVGTAGWEAVKKWEGWTQIAGFIQTAYDTIKGFADYVKKLNSEAESGGGGLAGLGRGLDEAGGKARVFTQNLVDGTGGAQSLGDALRGLQFIIAMISNPITALAWVTSTLSLVMQGARKELNEWYQTVEGGMAIEELNLALEQLGTAWTDLNSAIDESARALKPVLDELGKAWHDLMVVIYGEEVKKTGPLDPTGGGQTQEKITLVKLAVDALKLAIKALTIGIQIAIPFIQFFTEVIKFVGWITSGVIQIITFFIGVGMWLEVEFKNLQKGAGKLGEAFFFLTLPIQIVTAFIIQLWHWITGNSPGLIPAFTDLYLLIMGIWPQIQGIVSGAVGGILGVVSTFVTQTLQWFSNLPGQIGGALSSLQGYVVQEFWNAYYGAQSMVGRFFEIGRQIKDQVVNGIKSALGIASPSKVTYGLGESVSEGLFVGMVQWVRNNAPMFAKSLAKDANIAVKLLSDMFSNYNWVYYMNSLQSVGQTLATMTGNCYDAALAFQALANKMGISANLYNTFVNGIPHTVITLPSLGMWIDPSGIMGRGLQSGSPAGAPIIVNQYGNVVREEEDLDSIAKKTGKVILRAVRFGA